MRALQEWLTRLRGTLVPRRAPGDLELELRCHEELAAEEAEQRAGAGAARAARLRARGRSQALDALRAQQGLPWLENFARDIRYGFRLLRRTPVFTTIALLTLGLGIGASTAIFSLWNNVLYASLPGVANPERLVMLTNPSASGLLRGQWSRSNGPRDWVTYAEFEQLRDRTSSFAALMAAQSSVSRWRVRIDGADDEDIHGRLVSGAFFEVLGVQPAVGRLFERAGDPVDIHQAVISHAYWLRRFDGRPTVVGQPLALRNVIVTVAGVTPPGFIGESSGQQPDIWLPLRLQPQVLPGNDWLDDSSPDKVMWLHVFGRLKPGVTEAQAEAEANAVFRGHLEAFLGPATNDQQRDILEQRLQLWPGKRGAASTLEQFSASLTILLVAIGILMLIACANLANLLLARGAARQAEIAVSLALGASRGRLIRQMVTESLALAAVGGAGAIAVAYGLHDALVAMLRSAEPDFFVDFSFNVPMFAFAVGATVAATLVFGLLPAWRITRTDARAHLADHSRGAIGSTRELRSGRWLVGVQLALSLPLLVVAGLLIRTLYNLQHPDLGFRGDRIILAQVSLGPIAQHIERRDLVLRELLSRVKRIPGVQAATFTQLGLFTGSISTAGITVEGSELTRQAPVDSALDRVAAEYFTTLDVPLRRGRDISEQDRRDGPRVCVINEAFAERYFPGRDPIGLHLSTSDGGAAYEVVGVAANARMYGLRGDVEPRFFVPAEQRPSMGTSRTFVIRAASAVPMVMPALRAAMSDVDDAVFVATMAPLEDQMMRVTAEERTIARLAAAFGGVALMLAAIGLYGVLSFGVSRRTGEIAIRLALGAQARGVIGMILHESIALLVAGLIAGGVFAALAANLVTNRLYGVVPSDPVTMAAATGVLLTVALVAAYLPARRASRLDPMAVLHRG